MLKALQSRWRVLARVDRAFCILLAIDIALVPFGAAGTLRAFLQAALILLGLWIVVRLSRVAIRRAIWRLRNRLLVTYLFIAVVPVLLIVTLAGLGAYALISQLAVYLCSSELDRRITTLQFITDALVTAEPKHREDSMRSVAAVYRRRFPELRLLVRDSAKSQRWPADEDITAPPDKWKQISGLVVHGGRIYLWSHVSSGEVKALAMAPLSRAYLSQIVPGLGDVSLLELSDQRTPVLATREGKTGRTRNLEDGPTPLPPPYNRFDIGLRWISTMPVARWESPGKRDLILLLVHTRPSAVLSAIFNARVDEVQQFIPVALAVVATLFLVVEIVALVIGISLTRSITRAVHGLYDGTQRVMEGDFSHRIEVRGRDQLATLGTSFNTMTENLERLLAVAKEKERLQAELEIAREVQEQLYPKTTPKMKTLRLTAVCQAARMVSGDYYDYQTVGDHSIALAIGDVAGKGISAALLMATIQAALRMELRTGLTAATPGESNGNLASTGRLVSDLNQQLYATTSPEKYATFYFALYDEQTGELHYTNAGHLLPILVRKGAAQRLESNGTVVGLFPFSKYGGSSIQLESGDLLVCFTDGISEPENEYGEMYGEDRLVDLITKNADRDEKQIVSLIMDAVQHWTSAAEQADDMTLLLARKI